MLGQNYLKSFIVMDDSIYKLWDCKVNAISCFLCKRNNPYSLRLCAEEWVIMVL